MNIEFTEITILLTNGCDKVLIKTNFPCPFVVGYLPSQPPLELQFDCTVNTAWEYVSKNFPGVPVKIISTRSVLNRCTKKRMVTSPTEDCLLNNPGDRA